MGTPCGRFVSFAALLFVLAGCGEPKLYPVEGRVTVGDKALEKGNITFHPDVEKGNLHAFPSPPIGKVTDGAYSISTNGKPGAPAGWYKVTVRATTPSDPKDEYSLPAFLVNKDYAEPGTTSLSVEVTDGAGPEAYWLKLQN